MKVMSRKHPSRRGPSRPLSLCLSAILYSSIFVPATPLQAQNPQQDVAEAARREKARKAAQQKKESHVYTNEDLQQSKILTDQDRERAEARKNDPANPGNQPAMPSFDVENSPAPESLGEVARRYRQEKAAREAEEAAKSLSPSLFHMDLTVPAFAEPMEPVEPLAAPKTLPWKNSKPVARVQRSLKRDPFAPQMASPSLRSARPDLSANLPVPSKPALPLVNVAPHMPSVSASHPAVAPNLALPAVAVPVAPNVKAVQPRRPVVVPETSGMIPALPKTHRSAAVAPAIVPSAPRPTDLSVESKEPVAPHVADVAPVAPKSRRAAVAAPSLRLPGASASIAPAIGVEAKPTAPSVAPQAVVVAPTLPKSHHVAAVAPSLKNSSSLETVPNVSAGKQPAVPALEFRAGVGSPVIPAKRAFATTVPKLRIPLSASLQPPMLAPNAGPVAPSVATHISMVAPAAAKPTATVEATPGLIVPASPSSLPPALAPHVSPIIPPTEKNGRDTLLIQPGDSLWKLARRRLGKGSRWSEFLSSNPGIADPTLLQPGTLLVVPANEIHPRALPPNTYVVHSGDSLWKLAAAYFGNGAAWTCVAEANPQLQDANRIQVGQVLMIPTSCQK